MKTKWFENKRKGDKEGEASQKSDRLRMRRKLFFIVCVLLTVAQAFATPTIYKTWVGEDLEYLELTKRKAYFDCDYGFHDFGVSYKDTTLTLTRYYYTSGKFFRQHEDYLYKIEKLTDDTLILASLNEESCRFIHYKKFVVFVDKSRLYKADLKFQRIFFSAASWLYGSDMQLEIDSSGLVYFFAERNMEPYSGLYRGQLNTVQLDKLVEILKKSELDRFPSDRGCAVDAPRYNFKFYYNDKIKVSNGCSVPYFDTPLLTYLLTIYEKVDFQKMEGSELLPIFGQ